ncbi:MAG: YdcF family protein [Pseudomonadota bacterium]
MVILLPAGLWAAGFLAFSASLMNDANTTEPQISPDQIDGIVVFTGGNRRVASALSLLNDGYGSRLLISGVHPDTSKSDLAYLWNGSAKQFKCCVDLGLEARTTEGNAIELSDWSAQNKFENILLVTSNYHMPRALLETKRYAPGLKIIPYSIASDFGDTSSTFQQLKRWHRLAAEYTKYVLVRAKSVIM